MVNIWWYHQVCCIIMIHDDVIKWKHFPRYWPFVRQFTGHRWIPSTKASDVELCIFFDQRLNKRLSKQPSSPSRPLWRHCTVSELFHGDVFGLPVIRYCLFSYEERCAKNRHQGQGLWYVLQGCLANEPVHVSRGSTVHPKNYGNY